MTFLLKNGEISSIITMDIYVKGEAIVKIRKLIAFFIAAVMLVGILAGCQKEAPLPQAPSYKVTFVMKGHILSEQDVYEGQMPQNVEPKVQGLRFKQWLNQDGQPVDPYSVAVTQELRYEAEAYPDLSKHVPFMKLNDVGHLCPEDVLTADDLYYALHQLAVEGADRYFPGLYTGSAPVSMSELVGVMNHFFPQDQVAEAFSGDLNRGVFIKGMLALLGRSTEEKQTVAEGAVIPGDVHSGREDAALLLESCMEHTQDENGTAWADMNLPVPYEPGFVNIDGWLYYVQEEGYFLKDGDVGELHFGADGRYTSGDAELDAMVAELIKGFQEANPDKDRFGLLRVAYDHSVADYKYLRKEAYAKGATGWEIEDAKEMISTGKGNCYNFAAIFWALARGLGYEAYAISGNCTGSVQPHGWVQIEIDGEDYFFDPEWEYAYINENRDVKDMFMIPMDKVWWWSYDWYPI